MPTPLLIIIAILAGSFSNVLIKIGTGQIPAVSVSWGSLVKIATNPYIVVGVFLTVVTFPAYTAIYQRMTLGQAFPLITSSMFLVATLVSALFLKEALTPLNYLGIVVVVLGIWLMTR